MEIKEVRKCDNGPPRSDDPDVSSKSIRSSLSPPSAAISAQRCRRSSPLLSVLLASVGDRRDDDGNAQSILEDHLLRVWESETTTAVHTVSSSGIAARCHVETIDSRRTLASSGIEVYHCVTGGSVAESLACWTQARKGMGSDRSRDAVG